MRACVNWGVGWLGACLGWFGFGWVDGWPPITTTKCLTPPHPFHIHPCIRPFIRPTQKKKRARRMQVASFHMFMAGSFSSGGAGRALQADSKGLKALTTEAIRVGFQVVSE